MASPVDSDIHKVSPCRCWLRDRNKNVEKMKRDRKEGIQVWTAVGMLAVGCGLVVAGCIVPTGEVHDSVLWFFGECLIYAGSIFGIGIYVNRTVRQMRRELKQSFGEKEDSDDANENGGENGQN